MKAAFRNAKTVPITKKDRNLMNRNLIVETYQKVSSNEWLSRNSGNLVLRKLFDDILETPGLYEAMDIIKAPTLQQIGREHPVDVVYTWVNHQDVNWQKLFQAAICKETGTAVDVSDDSASLSRFHNKDELKYSLRSVEKNLPWVRQIFIFTNCSAPEWIDTEYPRIRWVQHEEVIPAQFLPVFNSHVIESYLHRIENLSDRFIYFNDDFFVMKELEKRHFFHDNGISRAQLEPYAMVSAASREGDADYLNASRNSADLLRENFGFAPVQLHKHVPYALSKSVLLEIESRFEREFELFRCNRFRMSNDLNLPSFLYHHYALATQRATLASCRSVLVKSNDLRRHIRLKEAEADRCEMLCINDGGARENSRLWEECVVTFLKRKFDTPASWERISGGGV